METPFPGMDPYLEQPDLWLDVHNSLMGDLRNALAPLLRPRYYVAVEQRIYLAEPDEVVFLGRADITVTRAPVRPQSGPASSGLAPVGVVTPVLVEVPRADEVREAYLEVRLTGSATVVTVVEILSPTNKRPGKGRALYLEKRQDVLASRTHLVEIDLLRVGERMPVRGHSDAYCYSILVSRAAQRPQAELFPFGLRDEIPSFALPLRPHEQEPLVGLNGILHQLYHHAGYDLRIDYDRAPTPPFPRDDEAWATRLLETAGLR